MDIIEAIEKNDVEFVKNNIGKFDPNQKGQYGFHLLHRAVYLGHLEIIELLIDNGADIDILDEDHFTPLHSTIGGNEDNWFYVIELLIKKGANVNSFMSWRDFDETQSKESILITAIKEEVWIEVIKLLLENGADVNFVDNNGDRAINYAYDRNITEVLDLLKQYGAEYDGKETEESKLETEYALGTAESYKLREKLSKKD